MAVLGLNVWTGGPLLALWIGSRVQQRSGSSLLRPTTTLAIFGSLAVITWVLTRLLKRAAAAYDRAIGAPDTKRTRAAWLGSDERQRRPGERPVLSALERIMIVMVLVAAMAFEIWFFFFSTSPIDQRSGRGSVPLAKTMSLAPPPGLNPTE